MRLVSGDQNGRVRTFVIRTQRFRGGVSSVPVGDERQGRTGQQLLELVGAQDLAAEIDLPDPRARPGAVQQRGLTHQQAPVLREKTRPVLPVTLLISNTPEFLSEIERQENKHTHVRLKKKRARKHRALLTSLCRTGSNESGKTLTGGHLGTQAAPPWSPPW